MDWGRLTVSATFIPQIDLLQYTRKTVRLLGPCFKTGKRKPFCSIQQRSWTAVQWVEGIVTKQYQLQYSGCKQPKICRHGITGFLGFLFSNFRCSLTALSRDFASFPHGTFALLVSHIYLALDGIYHQIRATIPNNSILQPLFSLDGKQEFYIQCCFFPEDFARRWIKRSMHNSTGVDYHFRLFVIHSPLLHKSLLFSFPLLNYMLKFSK